MPQLEEVCLETFLTSMRDLTQRSPWPRGKVLGGSSVINFMMYVRGNKNDYNRWATEFGAEGWSYDEVLPYFKSIESFQIKEHENNGTNETFVVLKKCLKYLLSASVFRTKRGANFLLDQGCTLRPLWTKALIHIINSESARTETELFFSFFCWGGGGVEERER